MAHLDSTLEFKYEVSITNLHIERESDITSDDYDPTNVELLNKKYENESELKPKQEVVDKMEHTFVNIYDDKFIIKEELLDITEQQQETDKAQHQLESNEYEDNELKDVENVTIKSEILDIAEQPEEADLQMPKPIIKKSESDEEETGDASKASEMSEDEDLVVHKDRKVCEAIKQEKDVLNRRDELSFNKEPRVVLEDVKLTLGKQNTQESLGEAANNDVKELATKVTQEFLPEKSRKLYKKEYNNFLAWKIEKKTTSFSENVILAYLKDLSDKFKPSSMWAKYSMLKSTLSIYNNIDITKYSKVIAFLKRSSEGHKEKKSLTFTSDQIKMFLEDSPDDLYLFEKVALIFGIMGACRRQELYNIRFDEVSNIDETTIMVKVSKTKTKINRSFVVTGNCYAVCKKYMELRPTPCRNPAFFLSYKSGKCIDQRIGINKFGALGKTIASFLNLPNPALYTGHCFRRTSATLLIDSGGDLTALKREGGLKASTVAESYIDESLMNNIQVSNTILNSIGNKTNEIIINIPTPSTSSTAAGSIININFQNCTILNLNNYYK